MAAGGTGNIQFGVSNSATELSYSALMAEFKKVLNVHLILMDLQNLPRIQVLL